MLQNITAKLVATTLVNTPVGGYLKGTVLGDTKGRFESGSIIRTSRVVAIEETDDTAIVYTLTAFMTSHGRHVRQ